MKTIELSNEKARTLAGILAKQWASLAIRLEQAATCDVNTPFRCMGEGPKDPAFLRRVANAKEEAKAIGAFLVALGADLPKVNREQITGPYRSPDKVENGRILTYKRKRYTMATSGPKREAELRRLTAEVLAQI